MSLFRQCTFCNSATIVCSDVLRAIVDLQPLFRNLERKEAWSETISNEITENLITFIANSQVTVGHKEGVTYLPLPTYDGELDLDLDPRSEVVQQAPESDTEHSRQIHVSPASQRSCPAILRHNLSNPFIMDNVI